MSLDELFATHRYLGCPDGLIQSLLKDKYQFHRTFQTDRSWSSLKDKVFEPIRSKYFQATKSKKNNQAARATPETTNENHYETGVGNKLKLRGLQNKCNEYHCLETSKPRLNSMEERIIAEINASALDKEEIFAKIKNSILNKTNEEQFSFNDSDHRVNPTEFSSIQSTMTTSTPIKSNQFTSYYQNLTQKTTRSDLNDSSKQPPAQVESISNALKENQNTNALKKSNKNIKIKINVRKENIKPQQTICIKSAKRNFIQENILNASTPRPTMSRPPQTLSQPSKKPAVEHCNTEEKYYDNNCNSNSPMNQLNIGSNPSAIFQQLGNGNGFMDSVRSFQTYETPTGSPKLWITLTPNKK